MKQCALYASMVLILITSACSRADMAEGPGAQMAASPTTSLPATTVALQSDILVSSVAENEGYFVAILAIEDPATPNMLYQAEPGKRLIAVEIMVGNRTGARLGVNPLNITLTDGEGRVYPPELGVHADQIATIVLDPGERVRGWVAFRIPDETRPISLHMSKEMFTEPFIRVSLLPVLQGSTPTVLSFERLKPSLPKLGEIVEYGGYSMTVTALEDPTQPFVLYPLEPGKRLVAIEVSVANISDTPLLVSPLYFILVDGDGFVYPAAARARDGEIDSVDLVPGGKVQGWVAFKIPDDARPGSIKFVPLLFSPDLTLQVDLAR